MFQSLQETVRLTSISALLSVTFLAVSADAQVPAPRPVLDANRAIASNAKLSKPITPASKGIVFRDGKPNVTLFPTDLAITKKEKTSASIDKNYLRYLVTFQNLGTSATSNDRTYQLVTQDNNGKKKVHGTYMVKAGLPAGATWKCEFQTELYAKLLWKVVLDGKDNNPVNDRIVLLDNRW